MLKNEYIVDNRLISFFFQLNNGWPILSYNGNCKNKALVDLAQFFLNHTSAEDMRKPLKKKLRLEELAQCPRKNISNIVEIYKENDDREKIEDIPIIEKDILKKRRSAFIIEQNLDGIRNCISKIYK